MTWQLFTHGTEKEDKMPNHFNEYEYSENTIGIKKWMVSVWHNRKYQQQLTILGTRGVCSMFVCIQYNNQKH